MTDSKIDLWAIETARYSDEIRMICGVDEAGRGPLAGPVYAAAVILPRGLHIDGPKSSRRKSARRFSTSSPPKPWPTASAARMKRRSTRSTSSRRRF